MGLLLLGSGHVGLKFHKELVCLTEGRGSWFDRRQGELSSSLQTLSLGLSRSTLDCCLDHAMVCMNCPWVHQLHIADVMTQGRRGHGAVSSGSKDVVDDSVRVVPLLAPGLLEAESSSGVEVLGHVFHSIGC